MDANGAIARQHGDDHVADAFDALSVVSVAMAVALSVVADARACEAIASMPTTTRPTIAHDDGASITGDDA